MYDTLELNTMFRQQISENETLINLLEISDKEQK